MGKSGNAGPWHSDHEQKDTRLKLWRRPRTRSEVIQFALWLALAVSECPFKKRVSSRNFGSGNVFKIKISGAAGAYSIDRDVRGSGLVSASNLYETEKR
jgi:hypothetical protein